MILRVFAICTVLLLQNLVCADDTTEKLKENVSTKAKVSKTGIGWINDEISNAADSIASPSQVDYAFEGRTVCHKKKKHHKHGKYLVPLLIGFVLIKSILLPVALKGLAVLSGKAVVLSLMSLILAAIVGLRRVAQNVQGPTGGGFDSRYGNYRRKDHLLDDRDNFEEEDPYRYYRDRRRK